MEELNLINEINLFDYDENEIISQQKEKNMRRIKKEEELKEIINNKNKIHIKKHTKDKKNKQNKIKIQHFNETKGLSKIEKEKYYDNLYKQKELNKITNKNIFKMSKNSSFKIIFDLNYNNMMNSNELKSLVFQIALSYGINKKNKNKIAFYLSNYSNENNNIVSLFEKIGANSWEINYSEKNFYEIEELLNLNKKFIYLSPESEYDLEEVNDNYIFVIGGLIDKTIIKNKSLERAINIENKKIIDIETRRLPLKKYIGNIFKTELNINTVVEILSNYLDTKDWKNSILKVLPLRNLRIKNHNNNNKIENLEEK